MQNDGKVTCGCCGTVVARDGATMVTRTMTTASLPSGWPDGYIGTGTSMQQATMPMCQRCLSNAMQRHFELVAEAQQAVLLERQRLAKDKATAA